MTIYLDERDDQYISLKIDHHLFGLPVKKVQDVIYTPKLTYIPLSAARVSGLLNLRGRIVTAIDLGIILNLPSTAKTEGSMSIILEIGSELYSFIVNSVGEVLTIHPGAMEKKPSTLDEQWRLYSSGVFQVNGEIMVILDEKRIFADLMPDGVPNE
jgi:purine-binding chemotaxis protein CheW